MIRNCYINFFRESTACGPNSINAFLMNSDLIGKSAYFSIPLNFRNHFMLSH